VRLDQLAHTAVCEIESCKTTQELRISMKYARKLSIFYYAYKSSKLLVLIFPCWDIIKFLNASILKKAIFELVQQFHHVTEIANVAIAVSACADQP